MTDILSHMLHGITKQKLSRGTHCADIALGALQGGRPLYLNGECSSRCASGGIFQPDELQVEN